MTLLTWKGLLLLGYKWPHQVFSQGHNNSLKMYLQPPPIAFCRQWRHFSWNKREMGFRARTKPTKASLPVTLTALICRRPYWEQNRIVPISAPALTLHSDLEICSCLKMSKILEPVPRSLLHSQPCNHCLPPQRRRCSWPVHTPTHSSAVPLLTWGSHNSVPLPMISCPPKEEGGVFHLARFVLTPFKKITAKE